MKITNVGGAPSVSLTELGDIVVDFPHIVPDDEGIAHVAMSPEQAKELADVLNRFAILSDRDAREKAEAERRKAAEAIPVDRTARTLLDGSPVTEDHREIQPSGMQKDYVVLSVEERAKGFVRPVRRSYKHLKCGATTTMGQALAETYARDPKFYGATFCATCGSHFPVGENGQFVWVDSGGKKVGGDD
jgi:hypothetical protein